MVSSLSDDKKLKVTQMKERLQKESNLTATDEELIGFLRYRDFEVDKALMQYKSTMGWNSTFPEVSIADLAPFMMIPEGSKGPDGAMFVLEDMKGGCARDKQGRPIVVSIGMTHGNALEMQKQMVYTFRRAAKYYTEGMIPSHFCVVEIVPPKGATASFRFPDDDTKALIDMQRQHFPGTLTSTSYMGGVPTMFVWAFKVGLMTLTPVSSPHCPYATYHTPTTHALRHQSHSRLPHSLTYHCHHSLTYRCHHSLTYRCHHSLTYRCHHLLTHLSPLTHHTVISDSPSYPPAVQAIHGQGSLRKHGHSIQPQ